MITARAEGMSFHAPGAYQPDAHRLFRSLSRRIRRRLPSARIAEIGSSAVRGLWSKGDLDIFVGVVPGEFAGAKKALKALGFVEKRGTLRTTSLWPFVVPECSRDVGVQLVATGSRFEFFVTFRNLMRKDARLRADYNRLKRGCSGLSPSTYRRVKSRFVEGVLAAHPVKRAPAGHRA